MTRAKWYARKEHIVKTTVQEVSPFAPYQEHHFQGAHDVGIAWNGNRIWVCLDGVSLLRAKLGNRIYIEFTPPSKVCAAAAKKGKVRK